MLSFIIFDNCCIVFKLYNLLLDNSQEESSNSSATGDFVFLNTSTGIFIVDCIFVNNL